MKNQVKELNRLVIHDKNKNPYLIIFVKSGALEYDGYIYKIEKSEYGFGITDRVGILVLERTSYDTFETMYEIEKDYRGLGIGKEMVEFSKEMALKQGARFVKLRKLRREVPSSFDPTLKIDANLILYLNTGFRLIDDYTCCYQTADMICDLFEEREKTNDEKIKTILDNQMFAYAKMAEIDEKHNKEIKILDDSLLNKI